MAMGKASFSILFFFFFFFSVFFFTCSKARSFTCNQTSTAKCQSLIGYVPANDTTIGNVSSLFGVDYRSLLGANNFSLSTLQSRSIAGGSAVRVPLPCSCSNGNGTTDKTPVYTVQKDDGLDFIARTRFSGLVTYQEIANANNIPDPNKILVGQNLTIPLPCSCDDRMVHLAHVVKPGSNLTQIAEDFGTSVDTISNLNGITDPENLKAGDILDVPLKACASSISSTAADHDLRVPSNSYSLTADNCILCSCSSNSYQLDCSPTQGLKPSSQCRIPKCGNLFIGNISSSSGCERSTCAYTGYTKSPNLAIQANLTEQNICPSASPAPAPSSQGGAPPPPNSSGAIKLRFAWMKLFVFPLCLLICLTLL